MRTSGMALRLPDFCVTVVLVLRNTFFDHKDMYLATSTGPGDRNANQIDFWVMRRTQAKAMLNCRVHRGAEFGTDHHFLVGSCGLQLSQPHASQPKPTGGYDSGLWHDAMVQKTYAVMITDEAHHLYSMDGQARQHTQNIVAAVQIWATALHGCCAPHRGSAPRTMNVTQDVGLRAKLARLLQGP